MELHKQRNEIESILKQDTLYLLVLDCKYTKMMQNGFLPFVVKDSGFTLKDIDRVTEVYKDRLKDLLTYDSDTLKKVYKYLQDFCKGKANDFTTIAMKEIQVAIHKYLSGQINKDLHFNN